MLGCQAIALPSTKQKVAKCHVANINPQKLRHIRKLLTKDTCQKLVQSLVMSHLAYANAILSGIPKTLINIMQCTQNQAARITIGKTKIRNDSATEIRRSLHWFQIRERIDIKIATHIYKCQNNQAPHVPTKAHNRKEDKTSRSKFFQKQSSYWKFPLPKDTHLLKDHSVYMAQNFGTLFPIVSKKAKQLKHSKES